MTDEFKCKPCSVASNKDGQEIELASAISAQCRQILELDPTLSLPETLEYIISLDGRPWFADRDQTLIRAIPQNIPGCSSQSATDLLPIVIVEGNESWELFVKVSRRLKASMETLQRDGLTLRVPVSSCEKPIDRDSETGFDDREFQPQYTWLSAHSSCISPLVPT